LVLGASALGSEFDIWLIFFGSAGGIDDDMIFVL
jgi:hypothetical protein